MMAALVCRSFSDRTIAFFETKKECHRFYILLGLLGVKASELHGDVTQTQR
jgi:ATP-dependent RNA helicase DDX27